MQTTNFFHIVSANCLLFSENSLHLLLQRLSDDQKIIQIPL